MQILKILTARSCSFYCFLTRTGMFHIKVHSTFNLQAIYYAFLFQVYNIIFLFMRNLLSLCPHITHTPTGSEKSGVTLVGGHILLCTKKKCASWSILFPRARFAFIIPANNVHGVIMHTRV